MVHCGVLYDRVLWLWQGQMPFWFKYHVLIQKCGLLIALLAAVVGLVMVAAAQVQRKLNAPLLAIVVNVDADGC